MDGADSAEQASPNWRLQLGSLGSGNHFIEVSLDEEDRVWLFLHSGSRGVGNRLARAHIKVAQELAKKWWIPLADPDLAYLVEDTDEFAAYLRDLRWAQHFALLNRAEMMDRVIGCLSGWLEQPVEASETVNTHHNYTEREKHFGKDVWLSRKGAIDASEGKPGLIPGSMGTRSYVVTGKGNRLSLNSSPHGAGREYSRNAARKAFSRAELTPPCRASSGGGPAPSWMRSRRLTKISTLSWTTPRTWSRCGTRCARSSTSRATDRQRSPARAARRGPCLSRPAQLVAARCWAALIRPWQAAIWPPAPNTGVSLNAAAASSPLILRASASRTLSSPVSAWLMWM